MEVTTPCKTSKRVYNTQIIIQEMRDIGSVLVLCLKSSMLSISINDWGRLFHNFTAEEGVLLIRERTIIDDENNAYITTYNKLSVVCPRAHAITRWKTITWAWQGKKIT